jgi:transposase-like protein
MLTVVDGNFTCERRVRKALRDTVYQEVQVHRYQCLKCKRTFRVYPEGTTSAQTSQRVKGLAVMLYLLGCALWGHLLSVGSPWGVSVQESGL